MRQRRSVSTEAGRPWVSGRGRGPGRTDLPRGIVAEQVGQDHHVPGRQHRRAQCVDERQLVIRSRLRGARQFQEPVGECRPAFVDRPPGLGVGAQRGLRLQQEALGHTDFGLGVGFPR